jgi:hypothetical protein
MAMDLFGAGGTYNLSNARWRGLLELAYLSGWNPAGTAELDGMDPYDGYFLNARALVTKDDALEIASALRRALSSQKPIPREPDTDWLFDNEPPEPLLGFPADYVAEFADYCAKGEFRIF